MNNQRNDMTLCAEAASDAHSPIGLTAYHHHSSLHDRLYFVRLYARSCNLKN